MVLPTNIRGTDRVYFFFFSSRRRHTRCSRDWSSDVCSSDLAGVDLPLEKIAHVAEQIPRAVLFVLADPDIEVTRNPRARVERRERLRGRLALEIGRASCRERV